MIAAYPGSFDPFTKGHRDILSRALKLFDQTYVVVSNNANKEPMFDAGERLAIAKRSIVDLVSDPKCARCFGRGKRTQIEKNWEGRQVPCEVCVGTGIDMSQDVFSGLETGGELHVVSNAGITADFLVERSVDVVVRGVRNGHDLNYEMQLEQYLRETTDVETIYLSPYTENLNTSSTLVRMFLQTGRERQAVKFLMPKASRYINAML